MRSAWHAVLCAPWRTGNGAISNAFAQPLICWPKIPGLPTALLFREKPGSTGCVWGITASFMRCLIGCWWCRWSELAIGGRSTADSALIRSIPPSPPAPSWRRQPGSPDRWRSGHRPARRSIVGDSVGICSGDGREHVVIAEPASGLAEGQGLAPQPLKAHQLQLPAQAACSSCSRSSSRRIVREQLFTHDIAVRCKSRHRAASGG